MCHLQKMKKKDSKNNNYKNISLAYDKVNPQ